MRLIRGSPAPFQGYSAQLPICPGRDPCSTLLSPSLSASVPLPPSPCRQPASPVCVLYKGNPRGPEEGQDRAEEGPPSLYSQPPHSCPSFCEDEPTWHLGVGGCLWACESRRRAKRGVPDWEAGEAGADSCSGYVSPGGGLGQAGPGWAGRYPGLSPALRLATCPSEGLHPGLAAAPRPALLALRVTL